jgi:hypothetical protein
MRRFLVVAHQTLASRELLEVMSARAQEEDTAFHLLVPTRHAPGMTWTEGHDRAMTQRQLDDAQQRMTAEGLTVTGEIGCDSPVDAVDDVLRRDGPAAYAGIIVSTLPHALSKGLKLDVPTRIQRNTALPVHHLVSHPVGAPV